MFALGKVYLFESDTLNTVVLHYLKNISTKEVLKEYDNLHIKIGTLYFSDDLKYYWEIKKHSSGKFPIAIYRLVEKTNYLKRYRKYMRVKLGNNSIAIENEFKPVHTSTYIHPLLIFKKS